MAGEKKKKKWWIAAIVIVVIIIAAAGGNSGDSDKSGTDSNPKKVSQTDDKKKDSNDENKDDAKNDKQEESVQTEFAKGDVVETKSLKVSFLDCGEFTDYSEYSEPAKGNKIIYATFEFENISDDNEYISTGDCYADGYDCKSYYDFDQESLDATLSKGRKTKGKIFFEVPKDAKEIKIEYDINFLTSDKIIFVYQ